jgi:tetratricopeptide (TPR) repeat protein
MKHFPLRRTLLLLLLLGVSVPALGQSPAAAIRLDPIPEVQALAAAGEPLELQTFIRIAYVFSGVPERELEEAEGEIRAHIASLRRELQQVVDPRQRAEVALAFMHENLLKHYDEKQTGLDVLLARGSYNCVSSGVLYTIFLKALRLPVWAVRTSDHAFCRLQAGEQAYDVETTSPFGFDPGKRKEFTDSFGRITGYSYVPPSNYRDRRDIGDRELLGLILYNRAAFSSERREFRQAVPQAVDAYGLLENEESYQRLITSLLNLASWHGMNGRFREALEFLNRAAARYGDSRLEVLRADLVHNWAVSLIRKGSFAEAEQLLDVQREAGGIAEQDWKELTVYLYQVRAQRSARGDYSEAAGLILEGLKKVGSDQGLSKSYEIYVHNSVVSLVRSARYQAALSLLDEALSRVPNSSVLRRDRSMVLEAAGR